MDRTSREILCGLDYQQIISCAGMSQRAAADKLGVGYNHFNQVVKRLGMDHWWTADKRPRPRTVTSKDIIKAAEEGYTQYDTAFLLDISYSYLRHLVKIWGLRSYFPANGGAASIIGKKGYCL